MDGICDDTMSMQSGFSGNEIQGADFGSLAGDDEVLDPASVEVSATIGDTKVNGV